MQVHACGPLEYDIEHAHADELLEVALLAGREGMIDQHHVGLLGQRHIAHLGDACLVERGHGLLQE